MGEGDPFVSKKIFQSTTDEILVHGHDVHGHHDNKTILSIQMQYDGLKKLLQWIALD